MLRWFLFVTGTWAQQSFSGVWHSLDVPSVVCPGRQGYATVTISKPTTAEYEPHILTVFRTAKNPVELSFLAKDSNGIVADQRTPVTLQGHARRLQINQTSQLQQSKPGNGTQKATANAANGTVWSHCSGKDCPESRLRRLFSMRRRMSSSVRRRNGGTKPININPMSWFSPRRRRALSGAAYSGAAAATGAAGVAGARRRGTAPVAPATGTGASYSSVRRRISTMGTSNSFHRRRSYQGGYGGSYTNPYSSYSAPYGYPSSNWAYQSFGGHMPTATPYGYTGANAYSSSSGLPIALAAGAGLLASYAMGHHSGHYGHYWHGYSQADMYKMQCASGAWTGGCQSCVSSYGAPSCNVLLSPQLDVARDDLMSTGFVPSQISWPLVVNVTHVAGDDFRPSAICPPQDPDAKSAWTPPPMKELFISLSALPSPPPAMLGSGPGYGYGNSMANQGGSPVISNLVLLCSCLGCCYLVERCRKMFDGPSSGHLYTGVLPPQGFSGGFGQPGHAPGHAPGQQFHQDAAPGHIVQGQVVNDGSNPYW